MTKADFKARWPPRILLKICQIALNSWGFGFSVLWKLRSLLVHPILRLQGHCNGITRTFAVRCHKTFSLPSVSHQKEAVEGLSVHIEESLLFSAFQLGTHKRN